MTDIMNAMTHLKRPKLLIRAARHGINDYSRTRDLKRLLKTPCEPTPRTALSHLLEAEARLEETRLIDDASYSVTRHVEILIAMLAEFKLLTSSRLRSA